MPKTYQEASERLKNAIRAALLKEAPEYGRSVWEEDLAEEIQCHVNTIRNAIRAKGLLNAAVLWCLCEKFPSFERRVYGKTCAPNSVMDLSAEIADLRATADRLEAKRAPVVALKRRA